MAITPNSIVTPQSINMGGTTIVNADSTNKKTLLTAGANGAVVRGIYATTDDTSLNNVSVWVNDGVTDFRIGTTRVAIASGTDGAANAVDLLNSTAIPALELDSSGNPVLYLKAGWILKASVLVAVTAAKTLTLVAQGKDF